MNGRDGTNVFLPLDSRIGGQYLNSCIRADTAAIIILLLHFIQFFNFSQIYYLYFEIYLNFLYLLDLHIYLF